MSQLEHEKAVKDFLSMSKENSHAGEIAREAVSWGILNHLDNFSSKIPDLKLEAGVHSMLGKLHRKSLFHEDGLGLNDNIEDDYELRGKKTQSLKYIARYKINEHRRRDTGFESVHVPENNLVFLGCSFTFGEGLSQNETVATLIAKSYPHTNTFNLGFLSNSPSKTLFLVQNRKNLFDGINLSLPTDFIFTFIDDHVRRVAGTSSSLNADISLLKKPYFLIENGELIARDMEISRAKSLLKFLGKSYFFQAFNLELPPIQTKDIDHVAEIFHQLQKEIKKKIPHSTFKLVIFPGEKRYAMDLIFALKKRGIELIDYSHLNIYGLLGENSQLLYDPHPSALTNDLYSFLLSKDLRNSLVSKSTGQK
jgi:hypothetical protein